MSTTLTPTQLVARESFKNVILNEEGFYPDDVRIVPLAGMTVDRMFNLLHDHVFLGTAVVFVRDDGAEFVLEKHERARLGGIIDHVLRRVRIRVTALGPSTVAPHSCLRHEERYVHPNHVGDLRDLSGHLVTC